MFTSRGLVAAALEAVVELTAALAHGESHVTVEVPRCRVRTVSFTGHPFDIEGQAVITEVPVAVFRVRVLVVVGVPVPGVGERLSPAADVNAASFRLGLLFPG